MGASDYLRIKCSSSPVDWLMEEARNISWKHFGKNIELYYSYYQDKSNETQFTKDARERYKVDYISKIKKSLVNVTPIISLSGQRCELRCDHCKTITLRAMYDAESPEKLYQSAKSFYLNGSKGILLSAGSRKDGSTLIGQEYNDTIKRIKEDFSMYIGVHAGYVSRQRVKEIKELGADSILIDVIGHQETLSKVYHIERPLSVVEEVISYTIEENIDVIPHICIGLHYGEIKGEYDAIKMLSKYPLKYITFIILVPTPGTPMASLDPPDITSVARVMAYGRFKLPKVIHSLGCTRPIGVFGEEAELMAIQLGCNRIAGISSDLTIKKCKELGLNFNIASHCCMIGNGMFDSLI
ncbi:MAG: hypothetical protein JL50_12890 [Peptococcaceae bacterium BICA1-7]|nr:MAG: hypothetical protein JL50_12890 [Peptococcaceae bacterium BICA1-7]HBV97296.1 radical SAM protein [Desulfotomaculum sp.]